MNNVLKLAPALALLSLAACDYPPTNQPTSVQQLGIATPDHPVSDPSRLEADNRAPMQVPIPAPAVGRSTDAGANDEGGMIEPRE